MNQIALILCLSTLSYSFSSCEKSKAEKVYSDSIAGSWELHGAMGMIPFKTYPPGNGNILRFTGTSYQIFSKGQLQKSGTYAVIRDTSVEASTCLVIKDGQYENRIVYDGDDSTRKVFFQITKDTLKIRTGCFAYDAGTFEEYLRLESSNQAEY